MSEKHYFDLHTSGLGYLNRARFVEVRQGEGYLAVDIVALTGDSDDPQRTRFDCNVVGKDAKDAVEFLKPMIDARQKVLVAFKVGDMTPDTFVYRKGDKAGQTGVSLKCRLLQVRWAKVDGQEVELPGSEDAPRDNTPPVSEAPDSTTPPVTDSAEAPSEQQPAQQQSAAFREVALDPRDPGFQDKKSKLKQLGYRFQPTRKVWVLAA